MMRHREASRYLADLFAGELDDNRRAEIDGHMESCEECRDWSETYGFLAEALRGGQDAEHPDSEQLAHLAVDADLLTPPERDHLERHLEECEECRLELELSRNALRAARIEPTVARFPVRLPSRTAALRLALAASLILALAVAFFVARPDGDHRGPIAASATRPMVSPTTGAVPASTGDTDRTLTGDGLVGTQLIEAPRVITASYIAIESGSNVTLRAGEMVVLGDGFSVGSSASLGIKIASSVVDDSDSHS